MNLTKKNWSALLVFMPIAIVAIWLNQSNFAIGDDYHAFGLYFAMGQMDYFSAVSDLWKSPFMAGRPFATMIELLSLSMITSIDQLVWVRYVHLLMFGIIFGLFWKIIKKCGGSSVLASLIALVMFTLPGIWHMYLMNYGSSMLLAMCVALIGALLTVNQSSLSFRQWFIFLSVTAFVIFTYQPAWPLLFIGLFSKMLSITVRKDLNAIIKNDGKNISSFDSDEIKNYSYSFVVALLMVLGVFVANFVLVKYGYNSSRLQVNIDWVGKLTYVFSDLFPLTIYPWFYIWFPGQSWLKYLSWITYLASFFIMMLVLVRTIFWARGSGSRISLSEYIFVLAIASSLIPMALGMYLFTDQAIAFRRVQFASMVFWFTFLFSLACIFRLMISEKYSNYLSYGFIAGVMGYIFTLGYFLNVGTVQLASREWDAAVCASKIAPLSEPPRVDKNNAIVHKYFPEAWGGDEFQVSTFTYPTGGMLLWLAHREANNAPPAFSRWNIEFTDDLPLTDWDIAYSNCLGKTR